MGAEAQACPSQEAYLAPSSLLQLFLTQSLQGVLPHAASGDDTPCLLQQLVQQAGKEGVGLGLVVVEGVAGVGGGLTVGGLGVGLVVAGVSVVEQGAHVSLRGPQYIAQGWQDGLMQGPCPHPVSVP